VTDLPALLRGATEHLVPAFAPGDVVRRVRRRRRRRRGFGGASVLVVVALLVSTWSRSGGDHDADTSVVADPSSAPTAVPLTGEVVDVDGIVDLATGQRLELNRVGGPNASGPLALWSADRGLVVYSSYDDAGRRPTIRFHDVASGGDSMLSDNGSSFAWKGTGPLAFVEGASRDPQPAGLIDGRVVVISTSATSGPRTGQERVVWTPDADRYSVLAWAGDRLLIQRTGEDREGGGELLVADGPGQLRQIGGDETNLLGVSPDGSLALVFTGVSFDEGQTLELIDLATGAAVGAVQAPGLSASGLPGDWRGDRLLVSGNEGLAVLHFDATARTLVLTSIVSTLLSGLVSVSKPHLLDDGATIVGYTMARFGQTYELAVCDIAANHCERRPVEQLAHSAIDFMINPSRP
jgi:hypothetical protein